ncbi:MAG: alpha/beta hydrolase fold domain-containing protein [Bacteroidaceae bacterium]|nr:alpha/beta hydrolase fold domain-containing protein [Bacteroidaceae bacterium]
MQRKRNLSFLHRLFLCLLACSLAFGALQGQTKKTMTISIWDGTDNTDNDRANAVLYGFLPEEGNGKAVIICPGGGYQGLCMDYEGTDFATWFNAHGVAAFVLKYRLPAARHAVPLDDATRAILIVREHAADWGIDTKAVGIMGSSAGGHLASTLATHFTTDSRPDFQILLYPVITMDESYTHLGSRQALLGNSPAASLVNKYSNERQVKANTPQAFVVVSSADELVPVKNSLQYVQALINKNIPASLHIYPGGFHGFGHLARFEDYEMWHNELLYWLEQEVHASVPQVPEGTEVDYDHPLLKATSQLSDNCYWHYAGFDMSVNTLLDGNTATHFHSDATNKTPLSQLNQYIQMDMLEPQAMVQLYYAGRDLQPIGPVTNPSLSMINSPNHIIIMGTNTPADESSWTQLAEFTEGFPGVVVAGQYYSPAIEMATPMRYLRMIVKGAEQSNVYWNISELQLYACTPKNPDAVGAPKMEKASTSATYTLDGRQVSDTSAHRQGVYIVDGKKVLVK